MTHLTLLYFKTEPLSIRCYNIWQHTLKSGVNISPGLERGLVEWGESAEMAAGSGSSAAEVWAPHSDPTLCVSPPGLFNSFVPVLAEPAAKVCNRFYS